MKHLSNATTMFEKHVLKDDEGNFITEKNGKPKMVKEPRSVKDNGWFRLSQEFKNIK